MIEIHKRTNTICISLNDTGLKYEEMEIHYNLIRGMRIWFFSSI